MLDFNKPLQTRSGLRVELLATNASDEEKLALGVWPDHVRAYPDQRVVALVHHSPENSEVETFTSEGVFLSPDGDMNLINVPERVSTFRAFNPEGGEGHVAGHQLGWHAFRSLEEAREFSVPGWVGVLELIEENDKLVDVKFHANP